MDTITQEQRMEKKKNAPAHVRYAYGSPEAGEKFYELFTHFHLREDLYDDYINIAGDIILGFYTGFDAKELLEKRLGLPSELSAPMAERLSEIIQELFESGKKEENQEWIIDGEASANAENDEVVEEKVPEPQTEKQKVIAQEVSRERQNILQQAPQEEKEAVAPANTPEEKQGSSENPAPSAPETAPDLEEQKLNTPRYRRPLTNTPKYGGADPYREPPTP